MVAAETFMAPMTQTEPQAPQSPEQVERIARFLPGEAFYTERITLPPGMTASELDTAIETQLEAIAPFALEHLSFGAWVNDAGDSALVYASPQESLEPTLDELAPGEAAYPGFFPFLGLTVEKPCVVTAVCDQQLILLVFDQAGKLPQEVHCVRFEGETNDVARLERLRADLFRDLPWLDLPLHPEIYRWKDLQRNWKHQLTWVCTDGGGAEVRMELKAAQAARADVRDPLIKQRAYQGARWNQWLWMATAGSCIGLLLALALLGLNTLWSSTLDATLQTLAERQQRVEVIEGKERNLQVFESGSATRLQPLAMLDVVNRVRPDGIFFSEVRAYDGNHLQIDGLAEENGTALINQFRDALNELNRLESVSVEITRINQGVAYFFRANLSFDEMEVAAVGEHQ